LEDARLKKIHDEEEAVNQALRQREEDKIKRNEKR
jgi:hypothetical protein